MPNVAMRMALPAVIGVILGGSVVGYWDRTHSAAAAATPAGQAGVTESKGGEGSIESLRADVARLKANVPSQSHAMADVGYHWTNLWFAAEKGNWPLAAFYFDETRQHILWTIRIRPIRKGPDGNPVDLTAIFEGIDTSAFKAVTEAIQQQNHQQFVTAYRTTLEACYGCHKASGKPFLRPMMPAAPTQTLINFDPAATWPQ